MNMGEDGFMLVSAIRYPMTKTTVIWIVLFLVFVVWALTSKNRGNSEMGATF
jgi:preprotein translocase subunit SecG